MAFAILPGCVVEEGRGQQFLRRVFQTLSKTTIELIYIDAVNIALLSAVLYGLLKNGYSKKPVQHLLHKKKNFAML
jgi:hypothetical protein